MYDPDMLYTDGGIPFADVNNADGGELLPGNPAYQSGLEVIAYLYNRSIERHGENRAIYTQKDRKPSIYRVGVLDIEKSQLPGVAAEPWQTRRDRFVDRLEQFGLRQLEDRVSANVRLLEAALENQETE